MTGSDGGLNEHARVDEKRHQLKVSVKQLVLETVQQGDINFRFTSRSSAREGIRGHQKLQRSRPEGYEAEVSVSHEYQWHDFLLMVSGRIDGVFASASPVVIDEIKTLKIDVEDIPVNQRDMHWAQAKIYAWMYLNEEQLDNITVQLSYYQLDTGHVTEIKEDYSANELQQFFTHLANLYLQWMERVKSWQLVRDQSIKNMQFPFQDFRQGQRTFAVNSYRNMAAGQQMFIQGPTGTGKTIGTLFPAIKALGEGHHGKVFFLTAKTVGRVVAEKTIREMAKDNLKIKSLTITAKDKICFNKGAPCDGEHCEYARGYYDKIKDVLDVSLETHHAFTRDTIEDLARSHEVCPFELSLDLSSWVDCIICDYNYVFDPAVYLRRFFDDPTEDYCFLIDEAHNLVDRGREMFSAVIDKNNIMVLKRDFAKVSGRAGAGLIRKLEAINRSFLKLRRENRNDLHDPGYVVAQGLPDNLMNGLRKFCQYAEEWLATHDRSIRIYEDVLTFYFDTVRFCRVSELFDNDYVCLIQNSGKRNVSVKLYCLNPARLLKEGWDRGRSSLFFSATLNPPDYFQTLIGLDSTDAFVDLPSPFPRDNLGVYVVKDISTSYRFREHSYDRIVETIEVVLKAREGNYMVCFPSYAYLKEVYKRYQLRYPETDTVIQTPGMSEEERQIFLHRFERNDSLLAGFAVMGGVFGEGIDLKGKRLIGVVVVGVGLPQLGIERNLIRDYFNSSENEMKTNQGFEYAYQYPGMNRVLQTAGRVIRSENDCGLICLIDNRFAENRYRKLFPAHWSPVMVRQQDLVTELSGFWQEVPL
jgi:Rad3-related DNA helicase